MTNMKPARGFLNFFAKSPNKIGANVLDIKTEARKTQSPNICSSVAMPKPSAR